jgi:hypothetical protein
MSERTKEAMNAQDITPELIIEWAGEYASYSELETSARAIYGLYKTRQKETMPEAYKNAKAYKKKLKKPKKAKRKPSFGTPLKPNNKKPITIHIK